MKQFVKELRIVVGLVAESASFAFFSIRSDKLRTFLSLFGVTVGIFSIVAVFCAVDSLKANIMEGVQSFGSDIVYIDRFPMAQEEGEDGEPLQWWDYLQRPEITEENFEYVARNAALAENVVYVIMGNGNASYRRNNYSNAFLVITTDGLENVMSYSLAEGRDFSQMEIRGGSNVAILGYNVAQELFGDSYPVGKKVKVKGGSATVVGVLEKQGESMVSIVNTDDAVILPLQFGKTVLASAWGSGMMMAAPAEGVSRDAFIDELRLLLRSCRGLSPSERDDFAINEMTFLLDMLDSVFRGISKAGWIIGAFSLIIGGFGIANIMFVSVQERMNQIGIQKALGAKRYVILTQFMVEASFLSLAGGLVGILLVFLISIPVNAVSEYFTITLSPDNAIAGMLIAVVLGILSGLIPAWKAATVDPVRAING
ncbi:MAG TPA: ABC transporter permease [Candidatus Coprenecus stercorigallinarum]|nr:ABC transporter permease [Candidatus Coprenecus stercorigallinarum]